MEPSATDERVATAAHVKGRLARNQTSEKSRAQLLAAASELFDELGYERTTVREIGRRADVDPALIARYFGSKAGLYLETLRAGAPPLDSPPPDLTDPDTLLEVLERVRRNGLAPTLYVAIRPHEDLELQRAAMDVLVRRVVKPAEEAARIAGRDQTQLRAEIVTAALAGIVISRTSQALPTLAGASSEEVSRLVAELIENMIAS